MAGKSVPTLAQSNFRMAGYGYSPALDPCGGRRKPSGQRRFDETLKLAAGMRFSKILEVGCEAGHMLERLAAVGKEVVGVELSKPAVADARRRLKGLRNVRLLAGNFLALPLDGGFDLVCSVHVITDFEPVIQKRLVEKMSECLIPGGYLLSTVTARPFGLFDPADFIALLRRGFRVVRTRSFGMPGQLDIFGNLAILARKR